MTTTTITTTITATTIITATWGEAPRNVKEDLITS